MAYLVQSSLLVQSFQSKDGRHSFITGSKCLTNADGFHKIRNICLNVTTKSVTWFEAREFCKSLDADLATVNSMEAVTDISETIEIGGQFWVGLHRISWQNKDNKGIFITIRSINQWIQNFLLRHCIYENDGQYTFLVYSDN